MGELGGGHEGEAEGGVFGRRGIEGARGGMVDEGRCAKGGSGGEADGGGVDERHFCEKGGLRTVASLVGEGRVSSEKLWQG